jgi:hypothetical protein
MVGVMRNRSNRSEGERLFSWLKDNIAVALEAFFSSHANDLLKFGNGMATCVFAKQVTLSLRRGVTSEKGRHLYGRFRECAPA